MRKKSPPRRTSSSTLEAHKWKPGQSGNPGGRPRVIGELRDLAREHTIEALQTLVDVMRDPDASTAARVAAAAHILDRGYGKPTQSVEATVRGSRDYSDEELIAIIEGAAEPEAKH